MTDPESCLPERFVERLQLILPAAAYVAACKRMQSTTRCCVRVNTLKLDVEPAVARLRADGFDPQSWPLMPEAWSLPIEQRERLVHSALVDEGALRLFV